jgi:hypothetical protein
MKFIICSFDYDQRSGGIIALHKLGKDLADLNYSVNLLANKTIPGSKCKLLTEYEIHELITNEPECIVVYPEIVKGNPWCAKNVVRWVLYHPGVHGGDKEYSEDELVLTYSPLFVKGTKYEQCPVLFTFTSGLDTFKDLDLNRKGDCLLIKKGHYKEKPVDVESIDQFIKDSPDLNGDLLQLFNQYERFISMDHASYHSIQAALCGCIPIVIPDEGIAKEEWREKLPLLKYGVAYGMDDIEWAINTRELMIENLKIQDTLSNKSVLNFINILEKQMKSNIFIITSALYVDGPGINNLETRLYQTISTVNSIKANVKNAEIWILDASQTIVDQSIYNTFPKDVNFFKLNELFQDDILKIKEDAELIAKEFTSLYVTADGKSNISDVVFNAYIKSKTEAFMLNKFFKHIDIDMSLINRIYKISGRYLISDNFNQSFHNNAIDKVVFKKKTIASPHLTELEYQHMCMSWSIDASIFEDFKKVLIDIEQWLDDSYINRKQVVDLEHAFYKFLTSNNIDISEIEILGVMGLVNNEQQSFFNG